MSEIISGKEAVHIRRCWQRGGQHQYQPSVQWLAEDPQPTVPVLGGCDPLHPRYRKRGAEQAGGGRSAERLCQHVDKSTGRVWVKGIEARGEDTTSRDFKFKMLLVCKVYLNKINNCDRLNVSESQTVIRSPSIHCQRYQIFVVLYCQCYQKI